MHPLLLLHDRVPELLVEQRALSRAGGAVAGLSLDRRQPRRGDGRTARRARRSVPALPLPHDHELHQDLPEEPEPGQSHRRDQKAAGGAALDGRPVAGARRAIVNCDTIPRPRWAARAMASTRRLAAILAADVAGYSRLMGA